MKTKSSKSSDGSKPTPGPSSTSSKPKKLLSDKKPSADPSPKSQPSSTKPRPEPLAAKFVSNALNKPKSSSTKASKLAHAKKSKPRPVSPRSSTRKSKLAPPVDSGNSSEGEESAKEDGSETEAKVELGEESGDDDEVDASEGDDEDDKPLRGFSSDDDDDDSSDEDNDMEEEEPGIDVGKLPTIAKDDATVKRKLEKAKRQPTEDRGVIYIGRLPHGFYEDQLKAYFSQFGDVTRLRVSRNRRTGHSKHRAFLEFDSSSVAQIVAETMDNYLLMGHLLTCKVIPKDEVHPELWVGANRKWRRVPSARVAREAHNKPRTEEEIERATKRLLKRQNEKKRKLAAVGISYNMDKVSYKKAKSAKS